MRYWPFILVLGIVFVGGAMIYDSDDSDAATWYATQGVWFDNTFYASGDNEEILGYTVVNGIGGLTATWNNGGVRVYGTPTQSGTMFVSVDMLYIPEDEPFDVELYVNVSPPPTSTVSVYSAGGGTVSGGGTYNNGSTATISATPNTGYHFTNWSDGNTSNPRSFTVTGNVSLTAYFAINTYTVTWNNWDGTTLETDYNVAYGSTPAYNSGTPTRPATAQYSYTFTGWSPAISTVTGNVTYTAQYSSTVNNYTVTWNNWDGTTLETDLNVPYGTTPSYDGATPTRATTSQYTYTFNGWSPVISTVTGNVTYTAQFTPTLRSYTITWLDWDGTTLETDTSAYGTTPVYDGTTPTRTSTAQYTYTFTGWSPTISSVTGDATYTAQYSSVINTYTVTWLNWDDSVLEVDYDVPYGDMASYDGTTPTRTSTAQYTYTFTGWNPTVGTVVGDAVFTAQYTPVLRSYTITWNNWDGTTLETDTTAYGELPTYDSATPTRTGTSEYAYVFDGWNPQIATVTGDATYTAQFSMVSLYTVVWKNWDGSVLETDTGVPAGTMPTYDGTPPTRPATSEYIYNFDGWSPTVVPVTADAEYIAEFTTTNLYTVIWRNWDGSVLETDEGVPDGTTPTYNGQTPVRASTESFTYEFSGWSPAVGPISGYTEYTAQFTATALYLVTWLNWDGSVLDSERIPDGTTPTYSGVTPERAMTVQYVYTFTGWSPTIAPITEDTDYTAQFSYEYRVYTDGSWTYNVLDSGNTILIGYSGAGGIVQIPYSTDGRTVSDIGDALKDNTSVTGVVIPSSITTVGNDAFSGTSVTQVLNLSGLEITGTSYGLNDATVYTSIPGWFYIADVEYTDKEPDNSTVSGLIRIIPLLIIIGVIVIIARNRLEE